jgi:hypothetical protein
MYCVNILFGLCQRGSERTVVFGTRHFKWWVVYVSVLEPDSLSPDFRMNTDPNPDPDPIQIQGFYDRKLKKTAGKKLDIFLIKNCNLLVPKPK